MEAIIKTLIPLGEVTVKFEDSFARINQKTIDIYDGEVV